MLIVMGYFFVLLVFNYVKVQFLHTFVAHYIVAVYAIQFYILLHTTRSEKREKKIISRVEKTLATGKKRNMNRTAMNFKMCE